jgi:hypothetical protein
MEGDLGWMGRRRRRDAYVEHHAGCGTGGEARPEHGEQLEDLAAGNADARRSATAGTTTRTVGVMERPGKR